MNLLDLIKKRRSVRRFRQEDFNKEDLLTVLESATYAHSLGNRQALRFLVTTDPDKLNIIYNHTSLGMISDGEAGLTASEFAPTAYIIVCSQTTPSSAIFADLGAAFQNMALCATEVNLSLFWIHAFSDKTLKKELQINHHILAVLALGIPAENPSACHVEPHEMQDYVSFQDRHQKTPKLKPSHLIKWLE